MYRYLIDGYNLLFALPHTTASLEQQRKNIIQLVQEYFLSSSIQVFLVFDGQQEDIEFHDIDNLRLIFSSKNLSADQYILEEIAHYKHPEKIIVITSDKRLSHLAKNLKASVQTVSSFVKKLQKIKTKKTTEKQKQDTAANIQRLEKIFEKRLKENFDDDL